MNVLVGFVKNKPISLVILTTAVALLICAGGCRKKEEPVKLIITVEGAEFSDAAVTIDGKSVGRLTQTLTKANGELYVDGQLITTRPVAENQEEADQEDSYSGTLDSIALTPGEHTIDLSLPDGKYFQLKVGIKPGYHQLAYLSDEGTAKWDGKPFTVTVGGSITIR